MSRGRMDTQEKLSSMNLLFLRSGIPFPAHSAALWDLMLSQGDVTIIVILSKTNTHSLS